MKSIIFTKNDKISVDSPIVEKLNFYPPPSHTGVQFEFFFKTRGLSMGKNQNNRYRPLRVKQQVLESNEHLESQNLRTSGK